MGEAMSQPGGSIRDHLQAVLDLAPLYSASFGPVADAMIRRQEHLEAAAGLMLTHWLKLDPPPLRRAFAVEAGGHPPGWAPARVPWVRVYAPFFSERVLEGYFILWLFAVDGSRLLLSINQGIYVQDGQGWKPNEDLPTIRRQADEARSALDGIERHGFDLASIDLGADQLPDDSPARPRIQAYEIGSVYAKSYGTGLLPADADLRADLLNAMELLVRLYGSGESGNPGSSARPAPPDPPDPSSAPVGARPYGPRSPQPSTRDRELRQPGGHTPAPSSSGHPTPPPPSPMNPPSYP